MAHRGRHDADDTLAAALAAGKSVEDAAAGAGVSPRTAHRRRTDPVFRARVVELRGGLVEVAAWRLAESMGMAADTLRGLVTHTDPQVQLRAAVQVLRIGGELAQMQELAARMEEMKEKLTAIEQALGREFPAR